MWVVERALAQTRKPIQVKHLLKVADLISSQINFAERDQPVEATADLLDVVAGQVEVLQPLQVTQALDVLDLIAVEPQLLDEDTFF